MINRLFLPQNGKSRQKVQDKQIIVTNRRQFKLIHQLDCIYQGQINQSYQREGFGIQQTNNFQTYLGFWKCNKPNGIGMIIYPQGGILYGNFKNNQLFGVALTDNNKNLRIGVHQKSQIVGVGYEYNYELSKWKLIRFHKGVSIETVSTVVFPIQNGIPSMMNLHQDMHILLSKYLKQHYFDVSHKSPIQRPYLTYSDMNVHKVNNSYLYFGHLVDGKYQGLGVIYDKKNGYAIQTGFYQMGQINGYALRIDKDKDQLQIGIYNKGKKQGFFYQRNKNIESIIQYQMDDIKGQHPDLNRSKIKNSQKIFNYQKNDFYSQKNKVKFEEYNVLFQNDQRQFRRINQTMKSNLTGTKNKLSGAKQYKKATDNAQHKISGQGHKSAKYMAAQPSVHKSTVQVIRQKLGDIDRIIKRSKAIVKDEKSQSQTKNAQLLKPTDQEGDKRQLLEDGQIGDQFQPVSKGRQLGRPYYRNGVRNNIPLITVTRTPRKIWSPSHNQSNKIYSQTENRRMLSDRYNADNNNSFFKANLNQRSLSKRTKKKIFQ